MPKFWIVSSKHSRDESAHNWDSKWTANAFIKERKFYPARRHEEFEEGDRCILKVFGSMEFIGDFVIASGVKKDAEKDLFYEIDSVNDWDFPVREKSLPEKYRDLLSRSPSTLIDEQTYYELIGIQNFVQEMRISYKNRLVLSLKERDVEDLLASIKEPLKEEGLQIIERQKALRRGHIIDLICKDRRGDLVVIELKRRGPTSTVGQLALYVTDVKERMAKPGQKVSGLILASEIDERLVKAARGANFDLMLYQLALE